MALIIIGILWLFACGVVGDIASKKRVGYVRFFCISLFFSPLFGRW
jgi:hypothetical protein